MDGRNIAASEMKELEHGEKSWVYNGLFNIAVKYWNVYVIIL